MHKRPDTEARAGASSATSTDTTQIPSKRTSLGTFQAFQFRNFRYLWLGNFFSSTAIWNMDNKVLSNSPYCWQSGNTQDLRP